MGEKTQGDRRQETTDRQSDSPRSGSQDRGDGGSRNMSSQERKEYSSGQREIRSHSEVHSDKGSGTVDSSVHKDGNSTHTSTEVKDSAGNTTSKTDSRTDHKGGGKDVNHTDKYGPDGKTKTGSSDIDQHDHEEQGRVHHAEGPHGEP